MSKFTVTLLLSFCLVLGAYAQEVVFSDDFEDGDTDGWTIVNDGGLCDWEVLAIDANTYEMPVDASGNVLAADTDLCGDGGSILSTASFAVDLSAATTVTLEFDSDWRTIDAKDIAQVIVSTDSGITETVVLEYNGVDARTEHVTLELGGALAGATDAVIKFRTIQPGWDWWWVLDNVTVTINGDGGGGLVTPTALGAIGGDGFVALNWLVPGAGGGGTVVSDIEYHDGTFETTIGCGAQALCDFAVRFTPNQYPVQLLSLTITQGTAANSLIDVAVSLDPDALIGGPVGGAVSTITGVGGAAGTYTVDLTDEVIIESGDFYIGALEVNGFIGLGDDLTDQVSYIDRNWVSLDSGTSYGTMNDVLGGDPTLVGNLAITATVTTLEGETFTINARPNQVAEIKGWHYSRPFGQFVASSENATVRSAMADLNIASIKDRSQLKDVQREFFVTDGRTREIFVSSALTGYNVYRSEDGETFSAIGSVDDAAATKYTDAGVTNGTAYSYYVTALYDEGESEPSNIAEATPNVCAPAEATHTTSDFVAAVTNRGNIGDVDDNLSADRLPGFQWPAGAGNNQLFEGGVMIGMGPDHVSDAARVIDGAGGQGVQDGDFLCLSNISTLLNDENGTSLGAVYNDENADDGLLAGDGPNTPLPVQVQQLTHSFNDEGNTGYLIYELQVTNTGDEPLYGLLVGGYFDWDVGVTNFGQNTGAVDTPSVAIVGLNDDQEFPFEMASIWVEGNAPYMGAVPLTQNKFQASRIAGNAEEIFPVAGVPGSGMTEANKYNFMNQRRDELDPYGDPYGPSDKSLVFGLGGADYGYALEPGQSVTAAFAIVGGDDAETFAANGIAALQRWRDLGKETVILGDRPSNGAPANLVASPAPGEVALAWDAPAGDGGGELLSESFEDAGLPAGWTQVDADGGDEVAGAEWQISTGAGSMLPYDGAQMLINNFQAANGSGDIDEWLFTPELSANSAGPSVSTFLAHEPGQWNDSVMVLYSTESADPETFIELDYINTPDTWTEYAYTLDGVAAGQSFWVAFRYLHGDGGSFGNHSNLFAMDYVTIDASIVAGTVNPENPIIAILNTTPNPDKLSLDEISGPAPDAYFLTDHLLGYNVYRSEDGTNYSVIGTTDENTTAYTDPVDDGTYYYFVTAQYTNGESVGSNVEGPVTVVNIDGVEHGVPAAYTLDQNYPNPFNPSTTIRYSLRENSRVSLKVFNTIGQEVKTLVNGSQTPGAKTVRWDGTDNNGNHVASGIYIYRIEANDFAQTRKMIFLK